MAELIAAAPRITEHLDEASDDHFSALRAMLAEAGVEYVINPRLVRGLDYYTRTVFEWTTDRLGAQGAVCSGGRYDGLVEQLGGRPTPAIGWAMGQERLVELIAVDGLAPESPVPHAYLVPLGIAAERCAQALAEELRDTLPGLRLSLHCGGGSMKARMKRADRSGAQQVLILGDEELNSGTIVVKPLRTDREQETVSVADLPERLRALCAGSVVD